MARNRSLRNIKYFPLKQPIWVPPGATVNCNIWRRSDESRVWYEWCAEVVDNRDGGTMEPCVLTASSIHNPGGRSYHVKKWWNLSGIIGLLLKHLLHSSKLCIPPSNKLVFVRPGWCITPWLQVDLLSPLMIQDIHPGVIAKTFPPNASLYLRTFDPPPQSYFMVLTHHCTNDGRTLWWWFGLAGQQYACHQPKFEWRFDSEHFFCVITIGYRHSTIQLTCPSVS